MPERPDYLAELERMHAAGVFPPGTVTEVFIVHDDDCDHWRGKPCNCKPAVAAIATPPANTMRTWLPIDPLAN